MHFERLDPVVPATCDLPLRVETNSRRSRTAETVEASAGVTSTRWRRSVEEAIRFSVSRLSNPVTLPQLPDFLGAARVRHTDLQERLALEGDEPRFLQPPANRKRNNFLPYGRKYVLLLF